MQKVKNLFIIAVYLDSMWFRVDMLLTFICLARSENIRLFQLCEWNSCHVECDNVVYNGHSTYFKIFSIFFLHTHYSFIYSVYSGCCKHRWLFNQTASSCQCIAFEIITSQRCHCETAWMNQTLDHMRNFLHFNVLTSRASERTQQKIHFGQKKTY